jgi:hypothetical protein
MKLRQTAVVYQICVNHSWSLAVIACTIRFNIPQFHILSKERIHIFCTDLRTNSDYFLRHSLVGFYDRDSVFTARYGLDIFTQDTLLSVLTGLTSRVTTRRSSCLTGTAQVLKCMHINVWSAQQHGLRRMRILLYSSNKVKFLSLSACSDGKRKPNLHKFRMGGKGGAFWNCTDACACIYEVYRGVWGCNELRVREIEGAWGGGGGGDKVH